MSFRVLLSWWIPGYRTHKRRLKLFDKWFDTEYFKLVRSDFYPRSSPSPDQFVRIAKEQAIRDRQSWEQHEFNNPGMFSRIQTEIRVWRLNRNHDQRRDAVNTRWLLTARRKLLNLLKKRIVTLRMTKHGTPYPRKRGKVTSRIRKGDTPYRKR